MEHLQERGSVLHDGKDFKVRDPSPMVGLQVFHPEWSISIQNLAEMDIAMSRSSYLGEFYSPGLFISSDGFGEELLLKKLDQFVDVDFDAVKRFFPKAGHSHLQNWSGME